MQDVQTLEELGYKLGRKREEHGAALEHCARALHIRAKYLSAMEAGRFSDIPGEAYAKGYLQNYAAFLGFDRLEVINAFERIHTNAAASRNFYLPEVLTKENKPSKGLAIASLVAAVIFYGAWSITQKNAQPPEEPMHLSAVDIRQMADAAPAAGEAEKANPCEGDAISAFPPCYGLMELTPSLVLLPRVNSVMELSQYFEMQ